MKIRHLPKNIIASIKKAQANVKNATIAAELLTPMKAALEVTQNSDAQATFQDTFNRTLHAECWGTNVACTGSIANIVAKENFSLVEGITCQRSVPISPEVDCGAIVYFDGSGGEVEYVKYSQCNSQDITIPENTMNRIINATQDTCNQLNKSSSSKGIRFIGILGGASSAILGLCVMGFFAKRCINKYRQDAENRQSLLARSDLNAGIRNLKIDGPPIELENGMKVCLTP